MSYILEAIQQLNEMANDKSALASQLRRLICHMLKCKYQNEYHDKKSWRTSIIDANEQIDDLITTSNSLKRFYYKLDLPHIYTNGRNKAIAETGKNANCFPKDCEWTLKQLADSTYIYSFIEQYGQDC